MKQSLLSTSSEFDDESHYVFARTSGLPYGTFAEPERTHPLWWIVAVMAVALVLFLAYGVAR